MGIFWTDSQSPDRQTREDSRSALGHAAGRLADDTGQSSDDDHTAPAAAEQVHDHCSIITDWLHDECKSTTATALRLLAGIAPWYCETATKAIPVAESHLDDSDIDRSAMILIRSVALCNDQRRATLVDQLIGALPDPDSAQQEQRLLSALRLLVEIAEEHPDCRTQIDDLPNGLTDHDRRVVQSWAETLSSHWGRP
jgi:hypothetical protein